MRLFTRRSEHQKEYFLNAITWIENYLPLGFSRFAVAAAIALSNSPACTAVLMVLRTVMTTFKFGPSIAFALFAN